LYCHSVERWRTCKQSRPQILTSAGSSEESMPHFTSATMAQRDQGRESPRNPYPPHHAMEGGSPRNQYPPPAGGDDRSRHHQSSQPPVTLPPIRDPGSGYPSHQSYNSPLPAPTNGYSQGPPPPPPQGANGYPSHQSGPPSSLPPL